MPIRPRFLPLAAAALACSASHEPGPAPTVTRADSATVVVKPDHTPPAPGSVLAPVDEAWVERTLHSLSLREKAGQLVLAWISGRYSGDASGDMPAAMRWVDRDRVGGFIISVGTPGELAGKMNALQRRSRLPLLMVTDLESGPGMRLLGAGTDFPPVMGLAAAGSDSLAYAVGKVIGEEGRAVGIGLTLSPVLDVNSNPQNPIINTRSFGEDPASVGRFAADYVRGVHAGGLLAMGKHFPGHGDTHTDSHMALPRVDATRARLDAVDLPPFRTAIAAGMDGMLVGHIALPNAMGDDVPASISGKVTGRILRGEMGFRGLVSTDAFNMRGLTSRYGQGDAAVLAIQAGADLLLQPEDIPGVLDAVERAVRDGRISEARIDESVRRILAAKSRLRLQSDRLADVPAMQRTVGSEAHRRLAAEVAERSITLVRDTRALVPLAPGARRILSIVYADNNSTTGSAFNAVLGSGGRSVQTARIGAGTGAAQYASLRTQADAADVVVISAYVNPVQYRGSVEAGSGFSAFVESLGKAGKPVVVVSFGSPYLLRDFPSVPAYMLGWGPEAVCQDAAARALLGQAPISGHLPVTIAAGVPRGTGIVRGVAGAAVAARR
ncbi:MAG: glycoside hydrolase family 3 C-terminal domain-containing protein [Gemmatimonadetes bacterium]|nr:glycoside hydrolase family 3 C-terminal domain-containing protein [Gemmatimonadota bacterium]